jgi:hypothetical protein
MGLCSGAPVGVNLDAKLNGWDMIETATKFLEVAARLRKTLADSKDFAV